MNDMKEKKPELSEEVEKYLVQAMNKMAALIGRESDECFRCGRTVSALEQIGRSVYARPCGCRLWQGNVPEAWRVVK
jgi:hypothetical protein